MKIGQLKGRGNRYQNLGPVHKYPDLNKNASFFIRWRRRFRSLKTKLFENALQSGSFRKRQIHVVVWTGDKGVFGNADVTVSINCIPEHALGSLGIKRGHSTCLLSFIDVGISNIVIDYLILNSECHSVFRRGYSRKRSSCECGSFSYR